MLEKFRLNFSRCGKRDVAHFKTPLPAFDSNRRLLIKYHASGNIVELNYSLLDFASPLLQHTRQKHLHNSQITMTTKAIIATRKAMTSSR